MVIVAWWSATPPATQVRCWRHFVQRTQSPLCTQPTATHGWYDSNVRHWSRSRPRGGQPRHQSAVKKQPQERLRRRAEVVHAASTTTTQAIGRRSTHHHRRDVGRQGGQGCRQSHSTGIACGEGQHGAAGAVRHLHLSLGEGRDGLQNADPTTAPYGGGGGRRHSDHFVIHRGGYKYTRYLFASGFSTPPLTGGEGVQISGVA